MFQKSRSEDQQQDCYKWLHSEDKNRSIWRTACATYLILCLLAKLAKLYYCLRSYEEFLIM